ncbi:MAG: Ig-like domain-containing protein, partial [Clostridia bacterium]|nr:Ig-like domain-containing protein [Clostridia bacterium]
MRKSTRLLAIFLAVLMTVSVLPVSAFADEEVVSKTITAVDTTGLFMETVFPYNPGSGTAFWTAQVAYVENPTFYPTIPATVGGVRMDLPVTWECTTEYDGKAIGNTYTFEAVADEEYIWDCEVPVITVEIVDAGWGVSAARQSFAVADSAPVPYAVKAHSNGKNYIYDITGCNELLPGHGGLGASYESFAGGKNNNGTGKTFANPTVGNTLLYITGGSNFTSAYAGGHGVNHQGNAYIYVNDATVGTLSAGARGTGCGVTGDAHFDISGNVAITTVTGKGHTGNALGGTMYVNIHDLANTSTIGNIVRSVAPKLVVDLDSTSTRLLSGGNITGVTTEGYTDNNVMVNINGEKFVGMVDETTVTGIPEIIIKDEASAVLPTTFGSLSGFTWEGDLETSGTKTIKLVAPNGYFFDGLVKKKNFTVTVYDELVEVSEVTIDQGDVTINEGNSKTLTATVEPDNAIDRTVTWSTEDTDIISVDAVTGRVTALSVGVATVKATAGNVSDTCTVTVERAVSITDVDTEGLVLSTAFPYNDNANTSYWHTYVSNVTDPTFYPTLSVLVEGETTYTDVDVQWICTDENGNGVTYDSTAIGTTYYFEAMAEGYNFVNGAPVIEVKIVDAGMTLPATRIFGFSTTGDIIHTVIRDGEGESTGIYDATGYNLIAPFLNEGNRTDLDFNFIAGVANKAGTGKTPATSVTGDTKM